MKLSEIKGERLFDLVADITEPLCDIAQDEEIVKTIKSDKSDSMSVIGKIRATVPRLMHEHRKSLVAILAALKGVSPDEYLKNLTLASLLDDMNDMLTDEELPAFLS